MLNSIFLGILHVVFLGGVWFILYTPQCLSCGVRMQSVGDDVQPWGRSGVDAVFYYECPHCGWVTQRRHTITHLDCPGQLCRRSPLPLD
jgi:hypothetical protein